MTKKFVSTLSPEDQRIVDERAQQEIEAMEAMGLSELRLARILSRQTLTDIVRLDQRGVARMEKQSDLLIRSLRRYIEAMGGELTIVATFPGGKRVELEGFGTGEYDFELGDD